MSSQYSSVHSVHVYERDADLIGRLCAIVSTSLRLGDAVLIVATSEHRDELVRNLEDAGIDIRECVRDGRYTMLDAREALSTFLIDGMPDRERFVQTIGSTLDAVRMRARNANRGVTVFGEMVAVLWNSGNKEAALALERLWNESIQDRGFNLHCGYPRDVFADDDGMDLAHAAHTHIVQVR